MLIKKCESGQEVKFNKHYYTINAIIAANTKFQTDFSTEISFAMLNIGEAKYHKVVLYPKKKVSQDTYYQYINEVLKQQNDLMDQIDIQNEDNEK
jgi:hypothetical protein